MGNPAPARANRVLVVSSSAPLPVTRGGSQRTHLLMRALQQEAETELVYLHWDLDPVDAELEGQLRSEFGLRTILRPRGGPGSSPIRRLVWKARALGRQTLARLGVPALQYAEDRRMMAAVHTLLNRDRYDLVVVRYLLTAAVTRPFGPTPVIVDADDFEPAQYRVMWRAPDVPPWVRVTARMAGAFMHWRLATLVRQCDHLWVPSELERLEVSGAPATVLPNIPFGRPEAPSPAPDSQSVLLVASLRYAVNRRAVGHFVQRIWPAIRRHSPQAKLRVVGTGMTRRTKEALAAVEGVEAVGFVDDLDAEYERCLFTVAPMFHGGGTKIKVLESLTHRRACVTTAHVQEAFGSDLPTGSVLAVADSPSDFHLRCIELLDDPDLARRMADRGHETVRRRYTFDRFRAIVRSTLDEVMAG